MEIIDKQKINDYLDSKIERESKYGFLDALFVIAFLFAIFSPREGSFITVGLLCYVLIIEKLAISNRKIEKLSARLESIIKEETLHKSD